VAAPGFFDLDDRGAHVGQQLAGIGPGNGGCEVEDLHACKQVERGGGPRRKAVQGKWGFGRGHCMAFCKPCATSPEPPETVKTQRSGRFSRSAARCTARRVSSRKTARKSTEVSLPAMETQDTSA